MRILRLDEYNGNRIYTVECFTPNEIVDADCIQYILDNVDRFDSKYDIAMGKIEHYRCTLEYADYNLMENITEAATEYLESIGKIVDEEDLYEALCEVFG